MPLTDAERSELHTLIIRRRDELVREISRGMARARSDSFTAVAGESPDPGDEATASLVVDTDNAETRRDVRELRELEDALARMEDGTYGICINCGDEIPFARLRAYPGALRCVRCQSVYERTHSHPSEPTL